MRRALGCALFSTVGLGHSSATPLETVSIPSLDGQLALPGYWSAAESTVPRPAVIPAADR
jgi:hypothetical protein